MQDRPWRWDDVALFLALYREGSLGRAGARLGVDASTLSRRLSGLEEQLALSLFERGRDGLRATAAAERLLGAAEAMEHAAADFHRDAEGFERTVEGVVRVTAPPGLVDAILAPRVGALRALHPKLVLELEARVSYADLSRREADLALRTTRPARGDLVARKVVSTRTIPLGSADYVRALGTLRDVDDARWIVFGDDLATLATMRWLRAQSPRMVPALVTSSFPAQMAAARAGVGLVLAPIPFREFAGLTAAKVSAALQRSLRALPDDDLWLVGHRALRSVPRVAAVWQWLEALFAETPRR